MTSWRCPVCTSRSVLLLVIVQVLLTVQKVIVRLLELVLVLIAKQNLLIALELVLVLLKANKKMPMKLDGLRPFQCLTSRLIALDWDGAAPDRRQTTGRDDSGLCNSSTRTATTHCQSRQPVAPCDVLFLASAAHLSFLLFAQTLTGRFVRTVAHWKCCRRICWFGRWT